MVFLWLMGRYAAWLNSLAIVIAVLPVLVPILILFFTRRIIREYKTKKVATNHLNGRAQHANSLATITCPHARFCYETCFCSFHVFLLKFKILLSERRGGYHLTPDS
jgi:hypothetical protein